MRTALAILTLICAQSAFADTKSTLGFIERRAADFVANGFTSVEKFKVSKFDSKKAFADLKANLKKNPIMDCQFDFESSRRKNIELLKQEDIQGDSAIPAVLRDLYEDGKILAIHSYTWDGMSGDSEYCMIYYFSVYTSDGYQLKMEFNQTD